MSLQFQLNFLQARLIKLIATARQERDDAVAFAIALRDRVDVLENRADSGQTILQDHETRLTQGAATIQDHETRITALEP